MSEQNESTFQPHSDEELARLLEEQMRVLRSEAPIIPPQPAMDFSPEPVADFQEEIMPVEELGIDELFGALLEDTTDIPVVQVVDEENLKLSAFDENSLEHTQPITYVREEAVEAAIIDKHVVVEETAVEEVIEDAHVIAERVLSEISVDGELFATTISETAGAEPIPQMFGFAEVSEPLPAPVAAAPVSTSLVGEELIEEAVAEDNFDIFEQAAVETIADVVVEEVMVEDVIVEEVVEIVDAPQLRMNNPINSFAPRLTFDELVFGVKSDD